MTALLKLPKPCFGTFALPLLVLALPISLMAQTNQALAEHSADLVHRPTATTTETATTEAFEAQQGYLSLPLEGAVVVLEKSFGGLGLPAPEEEAWIPLNVLLEMTQEAKVRCIASGTVSASLEVPNFGKVLMIRHGTYVSVYCMLKAVQVTQGQEVQRGQAIGVVGKGYEEGMLHFELWKEKEQLNPLRWFEPSQIVTNSDKRTFRIR